MSLANEPISTRIFAQKAGVSVSTVSKWLRSGKIRGQKKNGKWSVSPEELSKVPPRGKPVAASPADRTGAEPKSAPLKPGDTVFSIEQFSAMTYLTDFGVRKWLKQGRLRGAVDPSGNPGVDPSNLDDPMIKRLLR